MPMASTTAADGMTDTPNSVIDQRTLASIPLPVLYQDGDGDVNMDQQPLDTIVSNDTVWLVEVIVITVLCGIISSSGLVANIINILVFFRQGALTSSSNVSLLALAFADIGCLIPVFANSVNLALFHLGHFGVFLTPRDFMDTVTIWPHIMCMQIVSWITAYIAFERCLCVLLPLKVKFLFSAKRSVLVTSCIAMIVFASFIPKFVTQRTAKMVDPHTNTTGLIYYSTELHMKIVEASDVLHAIILRPISLLVVFVCTQITAYRVKLSASWRKAITAMATSSSSSTSTNTQPVTSSSDDPRGSSNSCSRDLNDSYFVPNRQEVTTIHNPTSSVSVSPNEHQENSTTKARTKSTSSKGTSSSNLSSSVSKERRLVLMITMISTIFMVCNIPDIFGVFVLISLQAELELSLMDNLFSIIIAAQLFLESINSAINIFVYYRMSSTYKHTFHSLMKRH